MSVWDWTGEAGDEGDAAAALFTSFLGKPARLVRFLPDVERPLDPAFARPGLSTRFSDGFPFLLLSTASLACLNARIEGKHETPIPIDRFRANIVVTGGEAWEEDGYDELVIGGTRFRNVKPCSRCKVPSIDQQTGAEGMEPSATLHSYRQGKALGFESEAENWKNSVFVGVNLTSDVRGTADLHVGDAVEVVSRRAWRGAATPAEN